MEHLSQSHSASRLVTSPMTLYDLERSRSWPVYFVLNISKSFGDSVPMETSVRNCNVKLTSYNSSNKQAMLSQGEPRDAALNFDTYRILQWHVRFPCHPSTFSCCLCLQTASDKKWWLISTRKNQSDSTFNADRYVIIIHRTCKDGYEKAPVLLFFVTHTHCRLRHSRDVYWEATPPTHDQQ